MLKGHFNKSLGDFTLDVPLTVGSNELLVVLGASGCGKSTLLNCMAGFTKLDKGYFELDKSFYEETEKAIRQPINERKIAYIQQGQTLFPHLTVKENILYSIPKKRWQSVEEEYKGLLELLDLKDLVNRRPSNLSGGQQQRVAIGRCLMMNPKLILWDEPFSALDHVIREDLRAVVLSLKKRLNIPMVFVTHDLEEAFQLADILGVMSEGKILQIGRRDYLFNNPINDTVGKILGITNILKGTYLQDDDSRETNQRLVTIKCDDIRLKGIDVDSRLEGIQRGMTVNIGIRPEQILYVREEASSEEPLTKEVQGNVFNGTVLMITKHLESYRLKIAIEGLRQALMMDIPRGVIQRYDFFEGKRIKVLLKYKRILVMNVLEEATLEEDSNISERLKEAEYNTSGDFRIDQSMTRYRGMAKTKSQCPVIGIAGVSNSGKTRTMVKLIESLSKKGYRIATIKHHGHDFQLDQAGKDTYLYSQAGAKGVAIASRQTYGVIYQTPEEEVSLETLITCHQGMDLILVEGYKFSMIPKFEVIRKERSSESVCRQESLLGVITDVETIQKDCPCYGLDEIEEVARVIERIIERTSNEG